MIRITGSAHMRKFLEASLNSMESIHQILSNYGIGYCFIGGAVLPFYGYSRFTEDVDILVAEEDKDKLKEIPIGIIRDVTRVGVDNKVRRLKLHQPETLIDVVYSGEDLQQSGFQFPHPLKISEKIDGLPIVSLRRLIIIKLHSGTEAKGRMRDLGDVQELIRHNNLSFDLLDKYRDLRIITKYKELWRDLKQ